MKICISVILIGASINLKWPDTMQMYQVLLIRSFALPAVTAGSFGRERFFARSICRSSIDSHTNTAKKRPLHSTPTVTNVAAPYIMRNVGDVLLDSDALRLLFFQAKHHGAFLHSLRRTKTFWHFFWLQKERSSLHRLLLIPPSQQYPPNNRLDIID